jgi:hypothetical protein
VTEQEQLAVQSDDHQVRRPVNVDPLSAGMGLVDQLDDRTIAWSSTLSQATYWMAQPAAPLLDTDTDTDTDPGTERAGSRTAVPVIRSVGFDEASGEPTNRRRPTIQLTSL